MEICGERILHSNRWLVLKERVYRDTRGQEGHWAYAERPGRRQAVVVAARTARSNSLIVIEQFRVPFARAVLEFPAGLVDPGEDLAATALRELEEETGYRGEVLAVGPEVTSSAGLATETVHLVEVRCAEEPAVSPRPDGSESIRVLKIPPSGFAAVLERAAREELLLDAKLYIYLNAHQKEATC